MFQHLVERVLPRALAEIGENRDVASDQRLQTSADRPEDRARAHNDPAHDAESFHNPIAVESKSGRGHGSVHRHDREYIGLRPRTQFRRAYGAGVAFAGVDCESIFSSLFRMKGKSCTSKNVT